MSALATATIRTFATIAGGVLRSERLRLEPEAFAALYGEYVGSLVGHVFGAERSRALLTTAVILGGLWGTTEITEADLLECLRSGRESARRIWEAHQKSTATTIADDALREARKR